MTWIELGPVGPGAEVRIARRGPGLLVRGATVDALRRALKGFRRKVSD